MRIARVSSPAGRWRIFVRGLRASISASSTRLNAIATERAATIATTIQTSFSARSFARESFIAPGEQRAGQRERQREDGMLELDHLERQQRVLEEFPQSSYYFR